MLIFRELVSQMHILLLISKRFMKRIIMDLLVESLIKVMTSFKIWFGFRSLGIRITINGELYGYDIRIPEGHKIYADKTEITVSFRRHMPSNDSFLNLKTSWKSGSDRVLSCHGSRHVLWSVRLKVLNCWS